MLNRSPRVLLLYPPQAQPFLPHLALPLLCAVLKQEGIDASLRDLNLEAYEHFLSPAVLTDLGMDAARAAAVESAGQWLRGGQTWYEREGYYASIARIREALEFVSSAYTGAAWSLKSFSISGCSVESFKDILRATEARASNLFLPFYEARVDDLLAKDADLVGISVSWRDQLIPAFTLARVLKQRNPSLKICMGGSMISHLAAALKTRREPFRFVDFFIPMEGEDSLPALVRALPDAAFDAVPNLIWWNRFRIASNRPAPPANLSQLPIPDFTDLSLNRYYSPRPYLPVLTSRGCYWGKCAFCSHHISGNTFRQRKASEVVDEMDALSKAHDCHDFYLVDDSLPPALARHFSEELVRRRRPYRWAAELRLEQGMDAAYFRTLKAGGAHLLLFGLESGNQRVLDLMDKGLDRTVARRVLSDASQAGITTWVFFFVGFPGETTAEADDTLQFLLDERAHIDMVAGGTFTLTRNSPIFDNAERFGIELIVEDPRHDLELTPHFYLQKQLRQDPRPVLTRFKSNALARKFMAPFVAETHMLFLPKTDGESGNECSLC